ncbi:LacI family DNA-binding transcriptional regulator [Paenibacillus timonensis]|uniref:LacI family DNA-binding transcriptional regulator n=1 Tax=Paenibacillus timonensis TaxID=225915 RepID=A0ABW3SAE8_9BACL|nr:LacI family DNA-binding transcriptional regulator [Paenibacillus timonensis]MCH1639853.1 LacI family DNA-binding transcriptional regulator [Paenibacillus timonensis]
MTMQQIAEKVGVSKFAVSQALSGKPGVSEETRMRIVQAANELGYSWRTQSPLKDNAGRPDLRDETSLSKGTVIILMPNVRFQSRESLFWGRIIDGVTAALAERELGVMMVTEGYSDRSLKSINPKGVLGLIGIGYIATPLLLEIRNLRIPFVLVDHEDTLIPSDSVFMNNYDSMRQMTSLVLQSGRRDLRFAGSPGYSRSFHDRWLGYRIAMEEAGVPVPAQEEDPFLQLEEDAYLIVDREIPQLAANRKLPSAFVCGNDFFAYLILKSLIVNGVKVPEEVAVTGFDHTDEERDPALPSLSTIHVPNETLGRRAVEILFQRLADPDRPFEKTMIHGALLLRESFKIN